MESIELVVVQFEEVKRLISIGRIPQLRLALILLDSATELVLHRMTRRILDVEELFIRMLESLMRAREAGYDSPEIEGQIADLESKVTSKSKRRKLDYFSPKIEFLIDRQCLPSEVGPVLNRLHEYRNETYHRDRHRLEVLRPAVDIYFDVACVVLSNYQPSTISDGKNLGPEIERFRADLRDRSPLSIFDLPRVVADRLREEIGLDFYSVRNALMQHLDARLNETCDNLDFIEESADGLEEGDGVYLVQIDKGDVEGILHPEIMRSREYRYSVEDISSWRSRVALLASIEDKYAMFTEYAQIERDFEPFESQVRDTSLELEAAIQLQIDIALGK